MKKVVSTALIAFALFFVFTQPQSAADVVKGAGTIVQATFNSFIDFVTALTS